VNKQMLSYPALLVLAFMLDGKQHCGRDLVRNVRISVGSLYPLLRRLETTGWARSVREVADYDEIARPLRRYYRLTTLGREEALKAIKPLYDAYALNRENGNGRPRETNQASELSGHSSGV